jgi:tetratricopeptide (TPR) repeat protein
MSSMYYTKLAISSLLLLSIFSCSTGQSPTQETAKKADIQSTKSTKIELSVYTNALIALNNNELDKAQRLFTKMSKLQPDIAGSWANLALISVKKEQYKNAEKLIKTALQKNPKMVQALNLMASLEQRKGNIINAKELYQEALTYNPKYALAHYNIALIYDIYLQDIPKAINHYQLYLLNSKNKDVQTSQWLEGLQANIGNQ